MYEQRLHVAFDKMDRSAQKLAEKIDDLTRGANRNNLVIMCGEQHAELAHQFYETRLMHHMHQRMPLSYYFSEMPTVYQDELTGLYRPHEDDVCNAIALAEGMDYDLGSTISMSSALGKNIPVHCMDMPDEQDDDEQSFVDVLSKQVMNAPHIKNLVDMRAAKRVCYGKKVDSAGVVGLTRRDLFMTNQIHTVMRGNQNGPAMSMNGSAHLVDLDRRTLANFLLETGKTLVMVNFYIDQEEECTQRFLRNISSNKRNNLVAQFCVNLPHKDEAESIEGEVAIWNEMAVANNVSLGPK